MVNSVFVKNVVLLSTKDIITVRTNENEKCELMIYINNGLFKKSNRVEDKYEIKKEIGSGAFSTVKEAVRKNDCLACAIKIIDSKRYYFNEKVKLGFKREIEILKRIDHQNIIKFYECISEDEKIYIVTELMNGGSLTNLISKRDGIPEIETRILFKQILEGMKYLHDKNITHRDIKPDNILLEIEKCSTDFNDSYNQNENISDNFKVKAKIGDFGLAKYENNGLQTVCGTPQYLAPEIADKADDKFYDSKVDCWSLGVVLFQMISNKLPHKNFDKSVIDFTDFKWTEVSFSVIQLIENLLIYDKEKRYSVDEALNHIWFSLNEEEIINDPYLMCKKVEEWGLLTIQNNNYKMDSSVFLIGANKRCNICRNEKSFSQLHVLFYYEDGTVYFVDKSKNSSKVLLNSNVVDKNKSIILDDDYIIKMIDSDDNNILQIEFLIKQSKSNTKKNATNHMHNSLISDKINYANISFNRRKRKYSDDNSNSNNNNIERAKRASTVKLYSEVKTKILVEYNKKFNIGRNRECLVIIDSAIVSNFHAIIERKPDGKVIIIDDSSNGTYINHKKIRKESVILKNNDKIIFVYKNFKNHKEDSNVEVGFILSFK
ncbi:kinase-like protein [Neocallimastix lanati (nom. inval.)]|uniref:non-specific serine/threonine protein kinase n=1 Tax=Neocallimastix californiae TaxID=1754190 RepID=A0A1Y2AH05_9FUNG|nr:kinase-like protein [Neocallimastix sp. JGI-2020a]ORY21786.1 kinase-like protein [Neocallimastix californiae]|eukprot:ORY21786.1 kinase-like protein [Neocallimastix californiae]